jgi:hypothetical protein
MLSEDQKKMLLAMIQEHSMKDVVEVLSELASDQADEMSDMYLKDRAIAWCNISELLSDVSTVISE